MDAGLVFGFEQSDAFVSGRSLDKAFGAFRAPAEPPQEPRRLSRREAMGNKVY